MTKQERILLNITKDKELMRRITENEYQDGKDFIDHGMRYIKAIKDRRMICSIGKVSASGMSRTIKFMECSKGRDRYNYLNFFAFFRMLGYNPDRDGYTRIHGCGMDMIFHTNYTIIHKLCRLGFISKKQCAELAQNTPYTI